MLLSLQLIGLPNLFYKVFPNKNSARISSFWPIVMPYILVFQEHLKTNIQSLVLCNILNCLIHRSLIKLPKFGINTTFRKFNNNFTCTLGRLIEVVLSRMQVALLSIGFELQSF